MSVIQRTGNPIMWLIFTTLSLSSIHALASGVMFPGKNPSVIQETVGVIKYTKESDGSFRGEERWRILVYPDGSRSIRMTDRLDATEVMRTVVLRVDKNLRPLDSYQNLWSNGQFRGSGYYWVEDDVLEARIMTNNGLLSQKVNVPEKFSWVTHPLGADGLHMWYYDHKLGGVQGATVYNTDTLGQTIGAILGRVHTVDLEFLGTEEIIVPAGEFRTKKYLMDGRLEIWVEPEENLMVRMRNQKKDRLYELVELERLRIDK